MMQKDQRDRILVLGAGAGGSALLDMFGEYPACEVVGIVDTNPDAPGIKLARSKNIPVYPSLDEALSMTGNCMVFNMTHNEALSDRAAAKVGVSSVVGGNEAKLFWHIIRKLYDSQEEARKSQIRLQAVIHNVREGIISIGPSGIIDNANPAVEQVFGYAPEELIGRNVSILMPEPDRSEHDARLDRYHRTGEKHVIGNYCEVVALHKDGHTFQLELNVAEMAFEGKKHFVAMTRDISDRKEAEEKLTQLAMYDQLTGLANRTLFLDRLELYLAQARRAKNNAALLFIDLDGFKGVNDTQGHQIGDALLKEVGKRLRDCTRESDILARMGGDEFTACLTQLTDPEQVIMVAEKMIAALHQPMELEGQTCHIGASIGIAIYPNHAEHSGTLLSMADTAMYQAKAHGKNTFFVAPYPQTSLDFSTDA